MSILWHHGVNSGKLTQNEYVAVTSTNTARIFNLYPQKGIIAEGSDADIVVIDPSVTRTISARTHWQATDTNVWEGWEVQGVTVLTVLRGRVVWEAHVDGHVADWRKGKFDVEKGQGRYLERGCFGGVFEGIKIREEAVIKSQSPLTRKEVEN